MLLSPGSLHYLWWCKSLQLKSHSGHKITWSMSSYCFFCMCCNYTQVKPFSASANLMFSAFIIKIQMIFYVNKWSVLARCDEIEPQNMQLCSKAKHCNQRQICRVLIQTDQGKGKTKATAYMVCTYSLEAGDIPCKVLLLLSHTWQVPLLVLHLLVVMPSWHKTVTIHMPRAKMGEDWDG